MLNRMLRGGAGGILATMAMTGVMYAGKALGLLQTPPPRHITAQLGRKANVPPEQVPDGVFDPIWLGAHFGYGTGSGVVFGLVRPAMPRSPVVAGLLYGGALWSISYLKVMPELGLYPHPSKESGAKTAVMLLGHAVYGVVLAACVGQVTRGGSPLRVPSRDT